MQNFKYENQGNSTYLVYQLEEGTETDAMSLGMITNNKIAGLASTIFTQMDETKFIKYDVSAKIPVSQVFQGPVNKKRLLGVFSGIVDAMASAEDYMIDINTIMLDLDYIFTDVSTCETILICLPVVGFSAQDVDLGLFFKNIMFTTQFDQTENCDYVAKIINYLNSAPIFSLTDFKLVLDNIGGINNVSSQRQNEPQQSVSDKASVVSGKQPAPKVALTYEQAEQFAQVKSQNKPVQNTPVYNVPNNNFNQQSGAAIQDNNMNDQQGDDKKISWFYLMQHYNKENAQLYKAQKAAKKNKGTPQAPPTPQTNQKKQKKQKKNEQPGSASFVVPGAPGSSSGASGMGFAIPGQPSSPVIQPAQGARSVPNAQSGTMQGSQAMPGQQGMFGQQGMSGQQAMPGQQTTPIQQSQFTQPQSSVQQPMRQQPQSAVNQNRNVQTIQQAQGRPMNFGETMVLGAGKAGETTVLNANTQKKENVMPYLIRLKNNEKISVNKPVFRIGKERSYVDYFISDNTAISRSHANIISRDGKYYITDTNSTNHTYIGGKMIQSNDEVEIKHGTKFCLANEDFEFRLY